MPGLFSAERARPYLITHDSNDSTDYINAVYVDVSILLEFVFHIMKKKKKKIPCSQTLMKISCLDFPYLCIPRDMIF